ncbi:MAG: sugar ABC transporter permease [Clostridia bacterium]|nr:sugar ABC transporter permease [Clostridia bacterium]
MSAREKIKKEWKSTDYELIVMALLGVLFLFVFAYLPMYGITLAFKDGDGKINVLRTLFYGEWIGFDNFKAFFMDEKFYQVLRNTLGLNLLMLVIEFPAPILLALSINEVMHKPYKKVVQSISIFPHFLSWTIFGGIILAVSNVNTGVINPVLEVFGLSSPDKPVNLATGEYIWWLIILSSLIKSTGWGSIIYLTAITGIDPALYEAAEIDGAARFAKMRHITLPSIMPTITLFFILRLSNMLDNSFEQFYVFQNGANLTRSEVLSTYIWKMSIGSSDRRFSYSSALGLFNSVIGFILLLIGNLTSKKLTGKGVF